jgi:hypothetical protein
VFCFDVEPDLHTFEPADPSPWRGFEDLVEVIPRLRTRLEQATGRPPCFNWSVRADPQIAMCYGTPAYVFRRYGSFFEDALSAGDAIGIHPHAWRWRGQEDGWVSDHLDQAWVNECLEMAVSSYVDEFGAVPSFHRYGAQWMSTATMNRLRELGVKIDLTVEPGEPPMASGPHLGGYLRGGTPDCRGAPRHPYHPDPQDFRRAARGRTGELWAIPLTAGRITSAAPAPRPFPPRARHLPLAVRARWYVRHPFATCHRAVGRAAVHLGRLDQPRTVVTGERTLVPVSAGWPSAGAFWGEAVDSALRADRAAPYLAFAIRTDSVLDPGQKRAFEARMDWVVGGSVRRRLVFVTPDHLVAGHSHFRVHGAFSRLARGPAGPAAHA